MAEKPLWEQIGTSFVQHYYLQFDTNRANLADIYVRTQILFIDRYKSNEE